VCAGGSPGRIEVFPDYAEGLDDIEGFSHLHLIYWLHRAADVLSSVAAPSPLKIVPFLDDVPRGVFATRAPVRPNPLGLSIVRLMERHGAELLVEDLDMLDGTPLLDIKPYVEGFDLRVGTRGGWTEQVSRVTFVNRGERRRPAE
jgi:tRNA-Thr(GGU) m(6)t(6)A37 methyltransferase TsaA